MTAFFSKTTLTNYITELIDVDFCQYGPALTIGGILTAKKKVFLIDHVSASMRTPFQAIKKEFNWFTLQPHSALDSQFGIVNAPRRFTLSSEEPYQYNIMFVDNDCYAEMKTIILNVVSAWAVFQENATNKQKQAGLFHSFCQEPITIELNNILQNICYWHSGEYDVDVCVTTKNDCFVITKKFYLNDENIENLKNNSGNIIANACNQPAVNYHTAQVELKDI